MEYKFTGSVIGLVVFVVVFLVVLTQWEVDEEKKGGKRARTAFAWIFGITSLAFLGLTVYFSNKNPEVKITGPKFSPPKFSYVPQPPVASSFF